MRGLQIGLVSLVVLLSLCVSNIESIGLVIVSDYIRCTEPSNSTKPTDDVFRRRLASYDSFEKVMVLYKEIHTILTAPTCDTDVCRCMGDYYDEYFNNIFSREDYTAAFTRVLKEIKASYKHLPTLEINNAIYPIGMLEDSQPFYSNFILEYEYSVILFYFYRETLPCGVYFYGLDRKRTANNLFNSGRESPCPSFNIEDEHTLQDIEDSLKCIVNEMKSLCVRPALMYTTMLLASFVPDLAKDDLYGYAKRITDSLDNSAFTSFGGFNPIVMMIALLFSLVFLRKYA